MLIVANRGIADNGKWKVSNLLVAANCSWIALVSKWIEMNRVSMMDLFSCVDQQFKIMNFIKPVREARGPEGPARWER